MKLVYLLPLLLLAACTEEEIPKIEPPVDQTQNLRMELTCDDCNLYYGIDTYSGYGGIGNSLVIDTIVTDAYWAYVGFLDSTESAVPFHATIYLNDVIVIDSIIIPDTMDYGLVGNVGYNFE